MIMKNTVTTDLSKVEGTYTKAIVDHLPEINTAYNDKRISPIEFKSIILDIVNKAKPTKGQKQFVVNMQKKKTKDQMLYYVYDAQLNGQKLGTNI